MNASSFQSAEGLLNRVITARLKPGTEFLTGIIDICKKHHIQQGYIDCCIGSLQKATFCSAKKDSSVKIGAKYAIPLEIPGPSPIRERPGFYMSIGKWRICTTYSWHLQQLEKRAGDTGLRRTYDA